MSLPEDEQRQLQEIEQGLYEDDPRFARLMRATDPRVQYERKLRHALLGVVTGAGLLATGAVTHRLYLEAAGVRPARSRAGTKTAMGAKRRPGQTRWARMMQRREERWRRRQEGNGGMPGRSRN